ncbi:NAD(P)-dependent oxidoreductase [Micromonospora olivasterospora]|uniref:3-hydroxyisobutyrate dehydrogenase-like beta-hydroxyacid dehydrogenase n=1 Tax=Micromonospora olivasterospora TaxID=1880 RepID=A0A562IGD3_MICOL|nr:NAD(P)-dependent oxidoreductase [Micromonospora olivasterospora]TWH70057.1 3-hydroxyisobutyrate dehydrogenase-like beta-hydroxyacid dehydrogenase [Micromonospora olivasterospora]
MAEVTVVGTGAMGAPIARNLLKAGFEVAVWNRNRSRIAPLVALGATEVQEPTEVFASGVVLSVLADDAAVREVFLDSGALTAARDGAVHVNLATVSPVLAEGAATVHVEHGVGYVAAPMFGGVPVAEAGKLNIVTAGDPEPVHRVRPLLEAVSAKVWQVGTEPRQANVVKVAGQLLIASAIQTMSEAVAVGERGGIDAAVLVELFTSTITPGPVYTRYGNLIAARQYEPAGFTPVLGRKDVDLARAQAAATGLHLPVGDLLSALLTEAIGAGHGQRDWASLAEVQRHRDAEGTR